MRVLVTGGAGFIGSNLARRLASDGHDVVAADSFLSATWANLVDFPGDVLTLCDHDDVRSMMDLGPFDAIFHKAAITGVVGPAGEDFSDQHRMLRNNVETFRPILDWAVRMGARLIWASSCSVYGRGGVPMREDQLPDPLNAYAFSKLTMERMAGRFAPRSAHPIVALRYSNVYGPGEAHKGKLASMIHQLATMMRAGRRPRVFRAGQQKRDFVYIDDVVEANVRALAFDRPGAHVFNAGAGRSWSFNDVVAELNRVLGTSLEPDYFDNPYGFTQDWTETDQSRARELLGHMSKFDLASGIDAYEASGKLGT